MMSMFDSHGWNLLRRNTHDQWVRLAKLTQHKRASWEKRCECLQQKLQVHLTLADRYLYVLLRVLHSRAWVFLVKSWSSKWALLGVLCVRWLQMTFLRGCSLPSPQRSRTVPCSKLRVPRSLAVAWANVALTQWASPNRMNVNNERHEIPTFATSKSHKNVVSARDVDPKGYWRLYWQLRKQ